MSETMEINKTIHKYHIPMYVCSCSSFTKFTIPMLPTLFQTYLAYLNSRWYVFITHFSPYMSPKTILATVVQV